jgi:hypothetical protein
MKLEYLLHALNILVGPHHLSGGHTIVTSPSVANCVHSSAIDGTLIPIQGHSGAEEPNFVCRNGYHAINVQAVAGHKLRGNWALE